MSELPLRVPGADPSVWARTSTAITGPGGALKGKDRRVPAERMLSPTQIVDSAGAS